MDDPIIITSGSEDERPVRATQWRKTGPQVPRPRVRVPPPADVEVISLTDSDENAGPTGGLPPASAPARTASAPPAPASTTAQFPVPQNPSASASISTQLPERSSLQDTVLLRPSPAPSYDPPLDDLDDPLGHIDFGTGDDTNPPDEWDGLGVRTSLATIPVAVPSGNAVPVGTGASEGAEDAEDALFDSYLNMDQMADEGALPGGGRGGDEQAAETGLVDGPASMHEEEGPSEESPDMDDRDQDERMQDLEEGEVDPDDIKMTFVREVESGEILSQKLAGGAQTVSPNADAPSTRTTGTPESGEVKSRGSGGVGGGSRPPSSAPSTGSVATTPPSTSTPAPAQQSSTTTASLTSPSASPRLAAPQPLKRTGTLVMPDISSYKGIRFKRSLLGEWENSFFSRALSGVGQSGKAPVSAGKKNEQNSALASVDAPRVDEVRSPSGEAHMQVDAVASTSVGVSTSLSPQQPAETSTVSDTQSTIQAQQSPPMETSAAINDAPPVSTQPAPISIRKTPSEPPATQPASSSSRPFIAPPRIPRPSTPVSLVDVLNEVRRDKLLKDERQLARKRSMADLTGTCHFLSFFPL